MWAGLILALLAGVLLALTARRKQSRKPMAFLVAVLIALMMFGGAVLLITEGMRR